MVLVDLKEARELLGKSRATIFRMIGEGKLMRVHVKGYQKSFVTLESVERNQGPQFQLKLLDDDKERMLRRKELEERFPHIYPPRRRDRTRQGQHPDRLPSSEE
jgi:hypothetical protein